MSVTLFIVGLWQCCVCCMIRCSSMHPLYGAMPGSYVPELVTCSALVAHRYTYSVPRYRTPQHRITFIPPSMSLWNDLAVSTFDGLGPAGFQDLAISCSIPSCLVSFFPFYSFCQWVGIVLICGAGVFGLIGCRLTHQSNTSTNNAGSEEL